MRTRHEQCVMVAVIVAALIGLVLSATAEQVSGSKHDFSGRNAGNRRTGVCTFCHTAHGGYSTQPAWNHTLPGNTYTWSEGLLGSGTPYPVISPTWPGPSRFCLSCHDGSTAIGDVALFNGQSWVGGAAIDPNTHDGDTVQIGTVSGDLTSNHPFAHPFPFAGAPSTYNGVTTSAGALAQSWQPDPTALGIRLFNEVGGVVQAGVVIGNSGVECSSCHDFHNGSGVQDKFFLRGSTDERDPNYICNKCHVGMPDYDTPALHPHGNG